MRKTLVQAILAAFCAILAALPMEGLPFEALAEKGGGVMLIAARNSFTSGGKLSAKSYVQDGLIAMWDGIENAGWGVHDPNATVWKDLSGNGYDLTMRGAKTDGRFSLDGAYAASSNKLIALYLGAVDFGGSDSYIECVFSFSDDTSETWGIALGLCKQALTSGGANALTTGMMFDFRWNTSNLHRYSMFYGLPYGKNQMIEDSPAYPGLRCGTYQFRGSPFGNWLNGNMFTGPIVGDGKGYVSESNDNFQNVTVGGMYWGNVSSPDSGSIIGTLPNRAEVKRICIYRTQLSSVEMNKNYAVDLARFNLPTT